jgi:hypothetical protein
VYRGYDGKSQLSDRIVGRTHHMLLSVYGARWRKIQLAMLTVYLDDSGTSPSQHVAIATGLIIPAKQILKLQSEWEKLAKKEGFSDFHTSEFVARNQNSEFSGWSVDKQKRVFARIRQVSKKYGARAVSFAINKADYEETMPDAIRSVIGKYHYTWAVHHLLSWLNTWRLENGSRLPPFEFVFDWMEESESKAEIIAAMDRAEFVSIEAGRSGEFNNYSFRRRKDIPGLQCVDAVSWICYQFSLFAFRRKPLHEFGEIGWQDFGGNLEQGGWLWAVTIRKEHLQAWVAKVLADPQEMERVRKMEKRRIARHGM